MRFIVVGIFKLAYTIGVYVLKVLTRNTKPFPEIRVAYKDSSKPYFIGFAVLIGFFYFFTSFIL